LPIPVDHDELIDFRERTFYRLLIRARRTENDEMIRRLRERGFDVMPSYAGLLANLHPDGSSISTLAARAGVTRQAASQRLKEIEARGFVVIEPDPDDARASIVRRTPEGERLLRAALEIVTELESDYAKRIGKKRFEELRSALYDLLEEIDPSGRLGPR
jgi:DNA-binding MarR family transcriptional regulator